ncbi:DUF2269 family protein [Natronospirillum operosum]|uniref:DUF2269 family protein n=1 Tax=Natronospirillum operosum TaxID=2759953 RepID=UPI00197BF33C|nr:DUF2269 family protein [Natronospirillum operosum]
MVLTPGYKKFALATHLVVSLGWLGGVLVYLALGVAAVASQNPETIRAAWIAMELTGWFVILPMAVLALLTGIVMAHGTPWGLYRHYWILISLLLTGLSIAVLLGHMPTVSATANHARDANAAQLGALGGDLVHAGLAFVVLLVIVALNVYKPPGLTPCGRRHRAERGGGPGVIPRWLKVSGAIVGILLLAGAFLLAGGHSPPSQGRP